MSKPYFTYGLASTKGTSRDVNQDTAIALTWSDVPRFEGQNISLFIVADGMGGAAGVKASQVAVQIVAEEITTDIFHQSVVSINLIMTAAVQKANRQVFADASDGSEATLTAALLIGNQAYIAHVGNTLAYYVSEKHMIQLTETHDLIALGHITWEDIEAGHHVRNALYRALGQSEDLEVDIITKLLEPSSYLLLSTDGLWALHRKDFGEIKPLEPVLVWKCSVMLSILLLSLE